MCVSIARAYIHNNQKSHKNPGGLLLALLLVGPDLVSVAQSPANIVQSLEQRLLAERIDLEVQRAPVGSRNHLPGKIHAQAIALAGLNLREELAYNSPLQDHR